MTISDNNKNETIDAKPEKAENAENAEKSVIISFITVYHLRYLAYY